MEFSENAVKALALRKLERKLTENFHFFGGDDRMSITLFPALNGIRPQLDKMLEILESTETKK